MKIKKDQKVFITGAASGIGRSVAIAMARRGAKLFLTDINAESLEETIGLINKNGTDTVCMHRALDISKYDEVKSFADDIHAEHGAMDIIINVAGIALFALIEDMKHEDWQKVINTNLWGPIHGIECFVPEMIRAGVKGYVVTVSSAAGLTGAPWHAAYSASKWGCVGLSEVLRYDLMQHGIGVSVVCPGAVSTPMVQSTRIINVNRESRYFRKQQERFDRQAVSPEKAAEQIIKGIEKNKFLVFTSMDIWLVYFLKRKCFPAYHMVMKTISRMLNHAREVK